ncbi:tetratricopeptide repeat protein [Embleya sp. NBC_00896]|uniref:tetratricopeptide repeat protein n=1 Tax=Embleya sp. NBC_00896 TaxID=2975961 RepID=UPI003867FD9C|nr:tetratricopeptide repeat protein [Embleya sp. NBC_00896]
MPAVPFRVAASVPAPAGLCNVPQVGRFVGRDDALRAFGSAGNQARAIPLYADTLADYVRVLGEDHPDTPATRNNLAGAYKSAGDPQRAIPLYESTLADYVRVLGEEHPMTGIVRANLANARGST